VATHCFVLAFHTFTSESLLAVANNSQALLLCIGSQAIEEMCFLCALIVDVAFPFSGSHNITTPFLSADANLFPSGDHAVHKTWFL
jgi:hypothetical protein